MEPVTCPITPVEPSEIFLHSFIPPIKFQEWLISLKKKKKPQRLTAPMHHLGFFLFVAFVCFVCFNDFLKYVYLSQIDLRNQHSWLRTVCLQGRAQPEGLQNSHFWEEESPHRGKQCRIKTLPLPTYQQHSPLPSCLSLVWNQPLPFLFFFFFLFLPLIQMQSENNCGRGGFS